MNANDALRAAGLDPSDRRAHAQAALRIARKVEHLMDGEGRCALNALEGYANGSTDALVSVRAAASLFAGSYLCGVVRGTREAATRYANLTAGSPLKEILDPHPEAPVDAVRAAWLWASWPLVWEIDGRDANVNSPTGDAVREALARAVADGCGR
jgi:hypothetical protein